MNNNAAESNMQNSIFARRSINTFRYARNIFPTLIIVISTIIVEPIMANEQIAVSSSSQPAIVNDVTAINPITVNRVIAPTKLEEIVAVVKNASGPVAIGGGRFSMGGQTATEGSVQLDMRQFNQILAFDAEKRLIAVESGATWRKIQEYIDPYNLSVKIMQSYSDFTVGGSLSVNVHGRYVGLGALVLSVRNIGIVLADGSFKNASIDENADLFYGAIGGYGGIGVIVHATLELSENSKVHRVSKLMPISTYKDYFFREIRDNPKAVFHNADIYPDSYSTVRATTYEKTDQPVTIPDRLVPKERGYWLDRSMIKIVSDFPGGKAFRQYIVDPIRYLDDRVVWRNYEASYSVQELEPASRQDTTYVLQEFFVPVEKFDHFVPKMAKIFNDNSVNVLNISIRHAKQDPGTLLAWAQQEVFAFVVYYKQGTKVEDRDRVGVWTRALIDAVIEEGGRYYLPYQIHATDTQFKAAYPGWESFFALKKSIDPDNKFRNKLWDAYYVGTELEATSFVPNSVRAHLSTIKNYRQDEGQSYLTMPEWYLVYSPDEYAKYIGKHDPSGFPYFCSISQFWGYYGDAINASSVSHLMVATTSWCLS